MQLSKPTAVTGCHPTSSPLEGAHSVHSTNQLKPPGLLQSTWALNLIVADLKWSLPVITLRTVPWKKVNKVKCGTCTPPSTCDAPTGHVIGWWYDERQRPGALTEHVGEKTVKQSDAAPAEDDKSAKCLSCEWLCRLPCNIPPLMKSLSIDSCSSDLWSSAPPPPTRCCFPSSFSSAFFSALWTYQINILFYHLPS